MSMQTLGSASFTKYIPFSDSANGTVDFGQASITTCGYIQANGNVIASRFIANGCGFDVYGYCGATRVDVSGTVHADTLWADADIHGSGFIVTCGNISTLGHIDAAGGVLDISSGSGNTVFKLSSNSGSSTYWAYMKLNSGGTVVSGYICPDTQGFLRFEASCPAPGEG